MIATPPGRHDSAWTFTLLIAVVEWLKSSYRRACQQTVSLEHNEQSPYTCMPPEHKPVRRGREMIDLLAVEEPKPAIDQLFKRMRWSSSALT